MKAALIALPPSRLLIFLCSECHKESSNALQHAARSSTSTARQSTGAGGGLNFFTDDTPGLKLSPVSAMESATLLING